jgi:hypothetical protein
MMGRRTQAKLDRIERKLDAVLRQQRRELVMDAELERELSELKTQVRANTDAEAAAVQVLNGIGAAIERAVAAASDKGATPEQLALINELHESLVTSADSLAAAVVAGTTAEG